MIKPKFSKLKFNLCFLGNFKSLKNNSAFVNLKSSNIYSSYNNFHTNNYKYSTALDKNFSKISEKENNSLQLNNSEYSNLQTTIKSEISLDTSEPEDYRTIYIENLPQEWTVDEIKVRLEQIGPISKLHLIKDSFGMKVGKVLAVYQKVEHVIQAIDLFKDKMPMEKPVKIRFFRESLKFKQNTPKTSSKSTNIISSVLIVKNLPDDLLKEDLNLFISEFRQPIHISYPRDHENEFKRLAFIYFKSNEDAEHVIKYANMRYVRNKQLFFQFSFNHYDITDFRTRIELGIKLESALEIKMYDKQIAEFKLNLENKLANGKKLTGQEQAKLEYLIMRKRKFEYALGLGSVSSQPKMLGHTTAPINKEKYIDSKSESKRFLKKDKIDYNQDKSILFFNSHKYLKKN